MAGSGVQGPRRPKASRVVPLPVDGEPHDPSSQEAAMSRSPIVALTLGGLLALAGPVLASHVTPREVGGESSCGPLSPGTVEFVVDASAIPDRTLSQGEFEVTVDLVGTVETGSVDFNDASLPVRAAFVAGADSGNLYEYPDPVRQDDGLTAPDGQPITSVSFCYVEGNGGNGAGGNGNGNGNGGNDREGRTAPATDTAGPSAPTGGPDLGLPLVLAGLGCLAFAALLVRPALAARVVRVMPRNR
jgi:hypothetical protein